MYFHENVVCALNSQGYLSVIAIACQGLVIQKMLHTRQSKEKGREFGQRKTVLQRFTKVSKGLFFPLFSRQLQREICFNCTPL